MKKYLYFLIFIFIIVILGFFYEKQLQNIGNNPTNKEISEEIKKEIIKQKIIKEQIEEDKKIEEKIKEIKENGNEGKISESKTGTISIVINEINKENLIEETEVEKKDIKIKNEIEIDFFNLNYSSNINNIIKIGGENLGDIEYINIGEYPFKPELIDGYLYLLIEENNYLNGKYFLFFQEKNGNIITYDNKINFTLSQSNFVVTDITPNKLKNDIARNIVLQGKGLSKVISIQLSNNLVLQSTSFNIISDNVLVIKIPKDLDMGKYNLNIMGTEGIYSPNIPITIIE